MARLNRIRTFVRLGKPAAHRTNFKPRGPQHREGLISFTKKTAHGRSRTSSEQNVRFRKLT